jgi:hypothetical protein
MPPPSWTACGCSVEAHTPTWQLSHASKVIQTWSLSDSCILHSSAGVLVGFYSSHAGRHQHVDQVRAKRGSYILRAPNSHSANASSFHSPCWDCHGSGRGKCSVTLNAHIKPPRTKAAETPAPKDKGSRDPSPQRQRQQREEPSIGRKLQQTCDGTRCS